MKKILIISVGVLALTLGAFLLLRQPQETDQEQVLLEKTLSMSKQYGALRYRTDNVLVNAKEYGDYDSWDTEMSAIIEGWSELEKNAAELEQLAGGTTQGKVSLGSVKTAQAYTKEEITRVVDKAPTGKKIMTLANLLGVDAKMAQLVLNQSQDEMSREAYGEEGDVFQACETRATIVKNTSKVTVFVGTIVATGGTAALASSGALAQTAVVVSGADLTLEITDDAAKIALGDKNKISSVVGDVRKVTEPAAAILMVSTLPTNMVKGVDKLNAVIFGADQLNGTIQSGSVIGIKLPTPTKEKPEPATEVSILEKEEVDGWMKEQGVTDSTVTTEDVENILGITSSSQAEKTAEEPAEAEATTETAIEATTETVTEEPTTQKKGQISLSEFKSWDEYLYSTGPHYSIYQEHISDKFGDPDVVTTKKGKTAWVYYDLITDNAYLYSAVYSFYDTGQVATTEWREREYLLSVVDHL
ncbi:MAG: hypothetical protein PHX30_02035 [Candidatus Pacebacteria bacterium]|nr:hypothetical protein [Candidatus Paceibacterota bacterium]